MAERGGGRGRGGGFDRGGRGGRGGGFDRGGRGGGRGGPPSGAVLYKSVVCRLLHPLLSADSLPL